MSLHQDFSPADRRIDGCIHEAEDEVAKEIAFAERCGWLVIQDGKVRGTPRRNSPSSQAKLTLGNLGIVLQQQLRRFQESHAWIAVREPVQQVGAAHLRQHVGRHPIRAQADEDCSSSRSKSGVTPTALFMFDFGVVDDGGLGGRNAGPSRPRRCGRNG